MENINCAWNGHHIEGEAVQVSDSEQTCSEHAKLFRDAIERMKKA